MRGVSGFGSLALCTFVLFTSSGCMLTSELWRESSCELQARNVEGDLVDASGHRTAIVVSYSVPHGLSDSGMVLALSHYVYLLNTDKWRVPTSYVVLIPADDTGAADPFRFQPNGRSLSEIWNEI